MTYFSIPQSKKSSWRIAPFGWAPGSPGLYELLARNYLTYLATWDEPLSYDSLHFTVPAFERLAQMSPLLSESGRQADGVKRPA